MKKQMLILTALLLSLSMMAKKQTTPLAITEEEHSYEQKEEKPYRHHIEVSYPGLFIYLYGNQFYTPLADDYKFHKEWQQTIYDLNKGYEPHPQTLTLPIPLPTISYYYQVNDWLQVGGDFNAVLGAPDREYVSKMQGYSIYNTDYLYIAPGVRFNFYHKNIVDLYSGLNLGVNIVIASNDLTPSTFANATVAWQATAFGVRFGKHIYGKVEVGYGYKGVFCLGIGGRF